MENLGVNDGEQREQKGHDWLQQMLVANQRKLDAYNNDMAAKNKLLTSLQAEIEELNKLYSGYKRRG